MRIGYFLSGFPLFSETFVLNQLTGMLDRGHEIHIHAQARPQDQPVHPQVETYGLLTRTTWAIPVPRSRLRRARTAVRLLASAHAGQRRVLLRALDVRRYGREATSLQLFYDAAGVSGIGPFDVLHCQFGVVGPMVARLRDIGALAGPLVVSFRGWDATLYPASRPGIFRDLFARADRVLPVSEALARRLVDLGCERRKISVLHSGINCRRFMFAERRRAPGEPTRLLTVGRLVEKKGIPIAIEAVARLLREGASLEYIVAGEGPLRSALEAQIAAHGISHAVRLVGWKSQAEVIALLAAAHVFVLPCVTSASGDQEGIPNSLKEAMAVGLPVVSTIPAGIPELVEDGVSGFLVPERDIDRLADRLGLLLREPERWPSMGRAGRARVEAAFDIESLNDELERIYRALAAGAATEGAEPASPSRLRA